MIEEPQCNIVDEVVIDLNDHSDLEREALYENENQRLSTHFARKTAPQMKAIQLLGFENHRQIARAKALVRLGLSEQDMYLSQPYFVDSKRQKRIKAAFLKIYSPKLPYLLGLTEEQIMRRKALFILGISEEDIEHDRISRLTRMGVANQSHVHSSCV